MKKQLFSLALLGLAWLVGGSAQAQSSWDEPAQDENGVYQIGTASELEWFAEYVNSVIDDDDPDKAAKVGAKAVLTADIDLTGIDHTPIGVSTRYKYEGTFDGQHHKIKNMIIDRPDEENVGFFKLVRGNASIKNLIIDSSCSVTGMNRVAGLIGSIQTTASPNLTILNCVNMADVHATAGVASGIIGAGQSGYALFKMHNCVNTGNITTDAEDNFTIAIVGYNNSSSNSQVWCCYNTGTLNRIDGVNNLFRGSHRSVLNTYDLVNTASDMQSQTNIPDDVKTSAGGFKTDDPLHKGELCYYLNHGIEMMNRTDVSLGEEFTQDLSDPNSIPMPDASGKKVYQVADLYCDGTPKGGITYSNTEGGSQDDHTYDTATGLCTRCSYPQVDWKIAEEDGFYHLSTPEEVEWFSHMVRDARHGAMKAKLDNDIDFGGEPDAHLPIGSSLQKFFGHFDGQGHRIKGMVLTTASALDNRQYDGNGFFGSVRGGGTDADGTVNNEVIIENLIIDKSCSVEHDNNFAGGLIAHVNSRNDNDSRIIIRYCGNEANVSTTGKQAAGILGCVENTEVNLTIIQCYNTGNIKGELGESAAICGWTGTAKDYLTKVASGCWNIGQVTGIDGNGYNLFRVAKLNNEYFPAPVNCVDLCEANNGIQGKFAINTENPIESGELCYLLNGDQSDITWTQDLGVEEMPNMWGTTSQVYCAGTVDCTGAAVGTVDYNNVSGETVQLDHNINDEIGMCDVCYTQFQEPSVDEEGYYELKNAGNVEWLSGAVAGGAGALVVYAKLMNDIDFLNRENLHSPIGPNTGTKFKGVFDGQGFRIKNMIIDRPNADNIGFFGFLQGNSSTTVKNLIIDSSCTIHGNNRVGGLTGSYQNGGNTITIENVVNEATVIAEHQDAGGIFGGHQSGGPTIIIRNCVNAGEITAKNEAPYAGALCCYFQVGGGSKIENFLNIGTVNGHMGGNIGRHNIGDVTNLIDLSDTEDKTQGVADDLTADDLDNGKVAYIMGFKQLIGSTEYPSPLNETEVKYVGEAGYATFFDATKGFELNGDVEANVAILNNTWFDLTPIENIPAGTPVILKGTYYNMLASDLPAINIANDLQGTEADTEADGTMYILAQVDDEVGFYKATTGTIIPAGKAYYKSALGVKAFYFDSDDATAIASLLGEKEEGAAIYNLAGQRLNKMQKGINIVKGKKILK